MKYLNCISTIVNKQVIALSATGIQTFPFNFSMKIVQNTCCGYSLDAPKRGHSSRKNWVSGKYFTHSCKKTYVVGTHKNCPIKAFLIKTNNIWFCSKIRKISGPSCSKLTMSLVNISLKFLSLNMAYKLIFLLKKMWKLLIFFSKYTCEFDIVFTRTVNILTTNKLVKLTMLWTTGPWFFGGFSNPQQVFSWWNKKNINTFLLKNTFRAINCAMFSQY